MSSWSSPSSPSNSAIIICAGSCGGGAMAAVINLLNKDLMHGMQQQPQVNIMAVKTPTETRINVTRLLYFPNISIQESHISVSTPECSFILSLRVLKSSMALVRLPSGAVVLGIKVQHCVSHCLEGCMAIH